MKTPVYFDYAATTPVDPRVADKMMACLSAEGTFGNPASRSHLFGWQAEEAVEMARRQVADLIGAEPREIVWTSGATESDNLALKGIAEFYGVPGPNFRGKHIITSQIEHKAILDTCAFLESKGFDVTYLAPGADGVVTAEQVTEAIRDETLLVSLMHVNNEVGTVTDLAKIGELCAAKEIFFHVDAAQSTGKLPIDVKAMNIDLLSISAHKMYGPKGVGALYVKRRPRVQLTIQIHGGGHERGMRSGTLATHQIVGMGEAARLAIAEGEQEAQRIKDFRDQLWQGIQDLPGIHLNGHPKQRVSGNLNIGFDHLDGEALLMALKDLAVSTGSACTSASLEPSYVLKAMGVSSQLAHASIRISLGRFTTEEEIEFAIQYIRDTVTRMRQVTGQAS